MGKIDWEAAEVEVSNKIRDLESHIERWQAENEDMQVEWLQENYPPRIALKVGVESGTVNSEQVTRAVQFADSLKSILGMRVFREVDSHSGCRFTLKPIYREVR